MCEDKIFLLTNPLLKAVAQNQGNYTSNANFEMIPTGSGMLGLLMDKNVM